MESAFSSSPPSSPSLPSVPAQSISGGVVGVDQSVFHDGVVASWYGGLPARDQSVVHRMYRRLCRSLHSVHRLSSATGIMYTYWLAERVRKEFSYTADQLHLLSYLWHLSEGGRKIIKGDLLTRADHFPYRKKVESAWRNHSKWLQDQGLIVRSSRNPARIVRQAAPSRYRDRSRPYITITDKYRKLIRQMDKRLYDLLTAEVWDDVTCGIK